MKQPLNHANPFAMLLMALAMSLTFLACEEKKKPAEPDDGDADLQQTEKEEVPRAVAEEVSEAVETPNETMEAETKQTPKTEAECPYKKIGSPITVEATFLESPDCDLSCYAEFRLADGEKISLGGQIDSLKKGTKVSITYQKIQSWNDAYEWETFCEERDDLESLTVLSGK